MINAFIIFVTINCNNMDYKKLKNKSDNFFLIAGPCVVENEEILFNIASTVKKICDELGILYIFKASYRKANRSRIDSFTGKGDLTGLELIKKIGESFKIPTTTDIHSAGEAEIASNYVDIIQIPAFLSRQTDILLAAGKTGKIINIKKGQFMSPGSMAFVVEKITYTGNKNILLTDRGTMFGYGDLILDFRGIPQMQKLNVPVIVDCTHSLQKPNSESGVTGGDPEMIETIARSAVAAGADGLFIETHPDPANALSDGANMLRLDKIKPMLETLVKIRKAVAGHDL